MRTFMALRHRAKRGAWVSRRDFGVSTRLILGPWPSSSAPPLEQGESLHQGHLRTSNPVESVFATVRHRIVRTKGALSAKTAKLNGIQPGQCRCENVATIEGRKSVAQSRPRGQIPKRHRGHQKCRLTRPPDRSRHPISCIARKTSTAFPTTLVTMRLRSTVEYLGDQCADGAGGVIPR
jgi:hypothetical protein